MFNISEFLQKFRALGEKNVFSREIIAKVLSEGLNTTVSPSDFKVKDNVVVFLGASGSLKSQIFIKKQKLLALLKEKCREEAPYDIK